MYNNLKISLYFPCRNESQNLEKILARIPDFVDEKIIVSNRSTDNTVAKAKALGFKVYEDNRADDGIGYGYAHMTGIEKSTGDIIIAADGDAEHPIENLGHIIKHMIALNYDFLYCSRYPLTNPKDMTLMQTLGIFLLNFEVRVLYGIKLNDMLSGMWLMKKEVKNSLNLTEGGWDLSPQIKLNAVKLGLNFGEYNISPHKRSAGSTNQQYFKTGFNHMIWILKNRFSRSEAVNEDRSEKPKLFFNLGQ